MSAWVVIIAVGLVSYGLRVAPLLAERIAAMPPRVEHAVEHAGTAALVALIVNSVLRSDADVALPVAAIAVAAGFVVAARGGSMIRVLAVGLALVVGARLVAMAITTDLTPLGAAIGGLP